MTSWIYSARNDGSFSQHFHRCFDTIWKTAHSRLCIQLNVSIALLSSCLYWSIFIASICMKFVTCRSRGSGKSPLSCERFVWKFYFFFYLNALWWEWKSIFIQIERRETEIGLSDLCKGNRKLESKGFSTPFEGRKRMNDFQINSDFVFMCE